MNNAKNTDKHLYSFPNDQGEIDAYCPSIHITKDNRLGINVGGSVYEMDIRDWHELAGGPLTIKDFE